ncbi:MAG: prolyl oligopeptidase family serine peptidase [Actinomycetota bacterium]
MVHPYGTWPSPLSAAVLAEAGVRVNGPAVRRAETWWAEMRPAEQARVVLVCRSDAETEPVDALPAPFSARTLVHEYGGGAWWLGAGDTVYFTNFDDQRLYRLDGVGGAPVALTPEPPSPRSWRYADGREHPTEPWLAAVRERHEADAEAINELVAIPLDDADTDTDGTLTAPVVLAAVIAGSGGRSPAPDGRPQADFVAAPRFSPDGRWLSWFRWNHPEMPWDATELCVAPVTGLGTIGETEVVAGVEGDEAIHGADWTTDGRLVFSTDRSGYWNLHAWRPGVTGDETLTTLVGSEIGYPPWVFGIQHWAELPDGGLAVIVTTDAADGLAVVKADGSVNEITTDLAGIEGFAARAARDGARLVVHGATATATASVVEYTLGGSVATVHRPADDTGIDPAWFSAAEPRWFEVDTEAEGSPSRRIQANVYLPAAPDHAAPEGERPPLVVMGHGGPTSHASPALNLRIQYWTSRGFAVADVNYGGSSGFGRAYRRLLDGAWGIVDVEDCIAVARSLAADGVVDGDRLAIRGGSAGGFTVLAALTSSDVFAAGTSLFGVADLEALAADTHKFESRYLDGLVGPYPERRDIYEARSPINHTDGLSCPILVLQGLEDEIVPPNQSEAIVAAVAAKGIPHAYVPFEGEQHGFRQAPNVIRSYELELWFYARVFGFEIADDIEPPEGAVGL